MDALVEWEDHTQNIVCTSELECVDGKTVTKGKKVRMHWCNKYYYGIVKDIETVSDMSQEVDSDGENMETKEIEDENAQSDSDDEDDLPLSRIIKIMEEKKPQVTDEVRSECRKDNSQFPSCSSNKDPDKVILKSHIQEQVENSDLEISPTSDDNSEHIDSPVDDSDTDPHYLPDSHVRICEVSGCQVEVFSSCHICYQLLCSDHFVNNGPCENDHRLAEPVQPVNSKKKCVEPRSMHTLIPVENVAPEDFMVDGSEREEGTSRIPKRSENVKQKAHDKRIRGEEYISPKTGKPVSPRNCVKPRCNSVGCTRLGRKCSSFSEEERQAINQAFYATGSLQLQREYIVRFLQQKDVKQRTVKKHVSRRTTSLYYHLPKDTMSMPVCKTMFLNTLNISEKTMRTALSKRQSTGTVEKDKRGGRQKIFLEVDKQRRDAILEHINKFPRMESHYCRLESKRDYLHPNLNKQTMYDMFTHENASKGISASYTSYCNVLKSQNISFHNPKKDMCKICQTYRKGDPQKKKELMETFLQHTKEKEAVRLKKDKAKRETDNNVAVATFDLQQVLYLPKTNDNQLFYKRRLANYNLTMYDLKTKECHCFLWHEGLGKRGSSEIGTCLKIYLDNLNTTGKKEAMLFADGCPGQNKNSIIATALLHYVSRMEVSIEKISLLYFEAYHGQNEGDSAHSAIKTAIENAGDLYVPSQLVPVFKLARRKKPYVVHTPQTADFLDFKLLSKDLRILSIRSDDHGGTVDWTRIAEIMVKKTETNRIFFKSSHVQKEYRSITLKQRHPMSVTEEPPKLYTQPPKISKDKFGDLLSLCQGPFPVVRELDYVQFFKSLPQ